MNPEETLSALVDGRFDAPDAERVFERLNGDAALRAQWTRYHLIGDALRDALPETVGHDLVTAVASRLEAEPTVLAPRPRPQSGPLRWLTGAAVAASCAGAVIFSAGLLDDGAGAPTGATPGLVQAPEPAAGTNQQTAGSIPGRAATVTFGNGDGTPYNPYLVRHSEYRVNAGVPGMSPYARLIGHRSGAAAGPSGR